MIAISNETTAWILGTAALVSALFVIFKGLSILLRISHDVIDLKEWVHKEMKQNSGKSMKDLALKTNEEMGEVKKNVEAIATRVDQIERKMPDV